MKKYELAANHENIINTMRNDCIDRNHELSDFMVMLDRIVGSINISLDSKWGSGKTFFVKQIAILLDYFRKKNFGEPIDVELEEIIKHNSHLKNIEFEHTYIPIYYDAWMFDDHPNPILSLIYAIVSGGYVQDDPTKKHDLIQKLSVVASAVAALKGINIDIEKLLSPHTSCLDNIGSAEEIKIALNNIFDDLITEKADKLVVIIDELDRCKPDYAVGLLEKIKHFINDDRVIFIYSTNKSQLIHTIKKFYGQDFNATLYLNRFFDFQFSLCKINTIRYLDFIDNGINIMEWKQKIACDIGKYFDFSLREYNVYFSKMKNLGDANIEYSETGYLYQVFMPFIWALRIVDAEKEHRFMIGEMQFEIMEIISKIPALNRYAMGFISNGNDSEKAAYIRNLYFYIFGSQTTESFSTDKIHIMASDRDNFFRKLALL